MFASSNRSIARAFAAFTSVFILGTGGAHAQCGPVEDQWLRAELNLGSVAAPLVENAGQLAEDVAFGALGSNGSAARFHADGGVTLIAPEGRARFDFAGTDGVPSRAPTEPLWGTVAYRGAGAPGTLTAWAGLRDLGLYGGATLDHSITSRVWRLRAKGQAQDLSRLALRVQGAAEITQDDVSGDLTILLETLPGRPLTLHPARVSLGEESSHLPFIADADGTLRLSGEVPEGAILEMVLVFAPYDYAYDAVADGIGGYVAAGTTLDAVESADGATGRDVVVVRLGEDGRTFAGMTVLASSGDDRQAGISARDGAAYVAGSAGAADFPVASKGGGKKGGQQSFPAPFAVRLGRGGDLEAGAYLSAHGISAARDVAVDDAGQVLIVGAAAAGTETQGEVELTTVLPVEEGAPSATYVLTQLDAELTTVERAQTFTGATTSLPLQVQIACGGTISVGLATMQVDCSNPHYTYHRYPDPAVTNVPLGTGWLDYWSLVRQPTFPHASWGYHALWWKAYTQNKWDYDPTQATSPAIPIGHVGALDATRLDVIELQSAVFPSTPGGDWQVNYPTSSQPGLETAIGAAAYGAFWKSPTYLNLDYGNGGGFPTDGTAVMETVFCAPDGFTGPIDLCVGQIGNANPIDTFDHQCLPHVTNASNQITFDYVRVHQWYQPIVQQAQELIMPGSEFILRFEAASPGGLYVADPPDGQTFAAGQVTEAAARQMAYVVEPVEAVVTQYSGGVAVSSGPDLGAVRAVDRTGQTQ